MRVKAGPITKKFQVSITGCRTKLKSIFMLILQKLWKGSITSKCMLTKAN